MSSLAPVRVQLEVVVLCCLVLAGSETDFEGMPRYSSRKMSRMRHSRCRTTWLKCAVLDRESFDVGRGSNLPQNISDAKKLQADVVLWYVMNFAQ